MAGERVPEAGAVMKVRFQWTNWTFGIWWGKFSKSKSAPNHFAVELGPLQIIWTWKAMRR